MALKDLLDLTSKKKIGISEERIEPLKPDMFIDFLQTGMDGEIPDDGLKFFFYQRVFLRVAMRYKYVYMVFPR